MTVQSLARSAALLLALAPRGAPAQAAKQPDRIPTPADVAFTGEWSPFAIPASAPRVVPSADGFAPGPAPVPQVGLFWTGGNPAAMPFEVGDPRADFQVGRQAASGDFRRPLDPRRSAEDRLSMTAWGPVEDRSAMIGRVEFGRMDLDGAPSPLALAPYGSSPFAILDTTSTDMSHIGASLEGAAGWRVGRLGVGLALGYAAINGRTASSAVPRRSQAAAPAVTLGLAREFAEGAFRAGATLRWTRSAETIRINAVGAGTVVYILDGFRDPEVILLPGPGAFYRRIERDGLGGGAGLSGQAAGWRWAVHGEVARHREGQWSRQEDDPARDTWDADVLQAGLAAQRTLARGALTLHGRWLGLSGTATRPVTETDSGGVSFHAEESAIVAFADLRQPVGVSGWGFAARLTAGYTDRDRRDPRADVALLLETLVTGGAIQLDRQLTSRVLLSGGLAVNQHQSRGAVPHPASLSPIMGELLYGEVALQAALARPWNLSGGATFAIREDLRLWLTGKYAARSSAEPVFGPLPPMDGAVRSVWGLTLGATLGLFDGS